MNFHNRGRQVGAISNGSDLCDKCAWQSPILTEGEGSSNIAYLRPYPENGLL